MKLLEVHMYAVEDRVKKLHNRNLFGKAKTGIHNYAIYNYTQFLWYRKNSSHFSTAI
jgi:hypothetical protein